MAIDAETLTGYADLGVQPPRPMKFHGLQGIRDAVDPKGSGDEDGGFRHECGKPCRDCVDDGNVVPAQDVRCLLQHIDYLQGELDQIEQESIDYFGDDDD